MPWDENDYPASMKNMDPLLRKKAIEIANALEHQGYEDERSIPIAHVQALEWYDNVTEEELAAYEKEPYPAKDDKHESNANIDLLDNDVKVYYEDDVWKVQTVGAERADQTFDYKKDAVKRAKEMAENKGSKVIIYKQDGDIQNQ